MSDVFSKAKRSSVMAQIRGTGNKATELRMIAVFRDNGITGWRRRQPIYGKPDFVFARLRLALFVDGCFWHGCPIHATHPKQNADFWREKLQRNRARDRLVTRTLRAAGWRVLRVWEHELRTKNVERLAGRLRRAGLSRGL